ncbi:helix-turn-helix domain-containing protein [Domibacillus sp. A3M-37]|uniref:PucR family transcriptional regulator n=1 Tax=Domibacillus TaxID=1433999 RepID=UPI00061804A7|nr:MULTISPECIES: helix-turn-helix domain-containing protein [Domibacillus]MCP3764612.1 helix-turn-helix domain-containing protein [Domibacillus sp. A3M-37]
MSNDKSHYFAHEYESIEMLADRISEALLCPITIEDANHQIIAYSRHEGEIDPVRIATIMRRRVPEHVINSLWKSGAIPTLFETEEPVIIPAIDQVSLGERVAISVRKQDKVIGFIWAQSGAHFSGEQMTILKEAAKAVKNQLLQHEKRKRAAEESHQEFFWKLLTGHFTTRNEVEQANKTYGLSLTGSLLVILFDFGRPIDRTLERQIDYLAETLQQLSCIARTYDGEQLVMLIRFKETDDLDAVSSYIDDFIAKSAERLGISPAGAAGTAVQNPLHVQDSYQETLRVFRMKQLFSTIILPHCFDKLGIFQSIEQFRAIRLGKRNAVIDALNAYDETHNANMLESIYTFLAHDGNVNDAARVMHVHPNTLAYRLKRISEITGFNSKDMNEKTILYIDLLIRHMDHSLL